MQKDDRATPPIRILAQQMSEGLLSSVALVQRCLRNIERHDARLNAFVRVFAERALQRAEALDAERVRKGVRGPLHGIPVAIKDLADLEGDITGFGSRVYGTAPAARTAAFVKRLEDAGMVIIGKTQMVEFAFGSWGTNHALGTPRNPHATDRHFVPGGSSSGSAVAVAAGLVPAAIGSDTGGSVRIPAALCGIVGLKTTIGAVSTDGVAPLSPALDTIGPMTRHVNDARLIFQALRAAPGPSGDGHDAVCVRHVDRDALEPLDERVWSAYRNALDLLARLGLPVRPVSLPRPFADFQADSGTIMTREAYLGLHRLVDDPAAPLDPFVRARIMQGATISDAAVRTIQRERSVAIESFKTILPENEVLVLPTTPYPALPLGEVDESTFPMSRFTRIANYFDLCGLSIPCGRTDTGMPIGLQLIAAGGAENVLLGLAERLEPSL